VSWVRSLSAGTACDVDGDSIAHSLHARQAPDDAFRIVLLVRPFDAASEGDATVGNREVEVLERNEVIRFERPRRRLREIRVARWLDFTIVGLGTVTIGLLQFLDNVTQDLCVRLNDGWKKRSRLAC